MASIRLFTFPAMLFLFCFIALAPARADFYKYRDAGGTVNITNDFNKVPPQYRSKVKIVKEEGSAPAPAPAALPRDTAGSGKADAPAAEPAAQNEGWLGRHMPLLKVAAVIGGLFCAALFLGKVVGSLLPNVVGKVIRIALLLGVGVFVFKSYSERVVDLFSRLKAETGSLQKAVDKSDERIRKQVDQ
ncbi:MAG: DUF4124 domain-containing protein [Deltaproteobacteria bacterium]|nr:DUF4124 domain-containing protein [Deltaproteobacteria bacterium]